jgi:ribosomal protein L31
LFVKKLTNLPQNQGNCRRTEENSPIHPHNSSMKQIKIKKIAGKLKKTLQRVFLIEKTNHDIEICWPGHPYYTLKQYKLQNYYSAILFERDWGGGSYSIFMHIGFKAIAR